MRSLLVRTLIGLLLCASAAVATRGAQSITVIGGDGLPAREITPPPTGTGLIMGRTVDADSGRPISGATVTLFRAGSTGYEPVMTDGQGRFVFSSLGAGTLTLRANKPGYLDGAHAKVLPNDPSDSGQPLDLGDDERLGDVTIKLWKYAVVGGTVLDETGEPMVGVAVRAMPKKFIGGRPQFSIDRFAGVNTRTDDRGQFRLSTLAPGDYVFVVPVITTTWSRALLRTPSAQRSTNYVESSGSLSTWLGGSSSGASGGSTSIGDDRFTVLDSSNRPSTIGNPPSIAGVDAKGTLLAYETTFHPATNALARAAVVTLRSGEERSGIDFRMRPVPSVRVSGTLMGPDGPAGEFVLRLVQTEISAVTTSDPEVAQTVTEPDGRFAFYGVPPGQYQIRGLKMPRPPSGLTLTDSATSIRTGGGGGGSLMIVESARGTGLPNLPTLWADTPVVVGDRNVDEAIVTLQTGFRIRGRIEFEGAAQKPTAPLTVYVERADGTVSSNSGLALGRTDEQGLFATQGQRPGKYYVRLPSAPAGWYFKGAMLGTGDISAVPIDLSRDIGGVVIKLSDKPATRLAGLVTDPKGQPQLAGMVVVFTANQQLWGNSGQTARNIISAGVGKGGRYTVTNLPPGDYFVVALGEAVAGWSDPKLLAAWSRTAARVTLADGDVKAQDLRVTTTPAKAPSPLDELEEAVEGHGPFVIEPFEEVEVDDQTPAPAQTRDVPPPAVGKAVIAGVVVSDDKARQPVRKAHVTLTGATAAFGSRVITTDETGRFEFADLPAGRFGLSASKAAYLAANYGAKEPGRQGTTITLTEAQRFADITLPMARGGVITGVIRDQAGQPVPGVTVQALQYRLVNGARQIGVTSPLNGGRAETDDRGQYRFYGLTPGEYVIGAAPRFNAGAARQIVEADVQAATQALTRTSSPVASAGRGAAAQPPPISRGRSFNYAPVFFPGTTIAADAAMVIVAKGEEKTGVDMALQLVPTALVEGVVTNPGGPLPSNLEVRLVAVSRVGPTPLDIGALLPVRPRADGKFSYTGVAPGQYAVVALAPAAPAGRGAAAPAGPATSLWATAELNVNGVDVIGVALSLQPGMTVSGKVTTDAKTMTPPSDFTGTRVNLQAILTGSQVSAGSLTATVSADGSFILKGIMPGRYKISSTLGSPGMTAGALVTGWMLRSAMVGGRDASEESFEVPGGTDVGDIVITFTDRPSEVSGVLQDATGRPATDYFIIVFPADRALWSAGARRVAQARPASDGRFTVRSLKAGSYLIAAVTDVEPGAINDPDFLEQLVAGAVKFELAEGEKKVQDIRIAKW